MPQVELLKETNDCFIGRSEKEARPKKPVKSPPKPKKRPARPVNRRTDPSIIQLRRWKRDRWHGYKPSSSMSGRSSDASTRSSSSYIHASDDDAGPVNKAGKKVAGPKKKQKAATKKGAKRGSDGDDEGGPAKKKLKKTAGPKKIPGPQQ